MKNVESSNKRGEFCGGMFFRHDFYVQCPFSYMFLLYIHTSITLLSADFDHRFQDAKNKFSFTLFDKHWWICLVKRMKLRFLAVFYNIASKCSGICIILFFFFLKKQQKCTFENNRKFTKRKIKMPIIFPERWFPILY